MRNKFERDAASRPQIPASEAPPQFIGEGATEELIKRSRGRPRKPERKVNQTLRLDADVLAAYRELGRGWQAHRNQAPREHMPHRPK